MSSLTASLSSVPSSSVPAASAASHQRSVRRMRRLRLVSLVAALLCVAAFVLSASHRIALVKEDWVFGLGSGCVVAGKDYPSSQATNVRFVFERTWGDGFSAAWRPFRAGNSRFSRVLFPIWQPMLVFTALAAFAHGVLVGRRYADPNACSNCGYDITALRTPAADGTAAPSALRCPECGKAVRRKS